MKLLNNDELVKFRERNHQQFNKCFAPYVVVKPTVFGKTAYKIF